MTCACRIALAFAFIISSALADNTGYATYSGSSGGVCSGVSSGLPVVSMNAAQFGGGSACGQCVQVQGTGNGAGQNPVSTAPYIAVVNNVCPQCAPGDIDLQESGSGKFGITWSFVACPGAGRKLSEGGRKLIVAEKENTVVSVSLAAGEATRDSVEVSIDRQREQAASIIIETPSSVEQLQDQHPIVLQENVEDSQGREEGSTGVEGPQLLSAVSEVAASRKLLA